MDQSEILNDKLTNQIIQRSSPRTFDADSSIFKMNKKSIELDLSQIPASDSIISSKEVNTRSFDQNNRTIITDNIIISDPSFENIYQLSKNQQKMQERIIHSNGRISEIQHLKIKKMYASPFVISPSSKSLETTSPPIRHVKMKKIVKKY